MKKLEIFEMLHEAAFKSWPTACVPSAHGGLLLSEDNGIQVFYGIELIVTLCKAIGLNYYITIEKLTGCPVVRVYE